MRHIKTHITLPPGPMPTAKLREIFQMSFDTYKWFKPERYGFGNIDKPVRTNENSYASPLQYFQETRKIIIAATTDRDYIMLTEARPDEPRHTGGLIWATSLSASIKPSWRETQVSQVASLMGLLQSPLAFVATHEDIRQKTRRLIDRKDYQEEAVTVRDYSEGLAGLFWRNFYGPPFVRLFGERLNALPTECVTRLGEELVLVQPYALPTEAGSEAARAREQQLISLLGPECFYDHEHHRPPTRRPVLPPPIAP